MIRALFLALILLPGVAQAEDVTGAALGWINAFRAENRRQPLAASPQLVAAAEAHGRDMARNGFFDHSGSDGSSIGTRVKRQGYGFCFVAENIAMGQRDLGQALSTWRGSRGHRKNMLDRRATEIGVARAGGNRWVMVLGTPGC